MDNETVEAFKHGWMNSTLLVALATSAFILQLEFLLIINSNSDSAVCANLVTYTTNDKTVNKCHEYDTGMLWSAYNDVTTAIRPIYTHILSQS